MANATAQVAAQKVAWGDTRRKYPGKGGSSTTFYTGQMVGQRAADQYATHLDDTAALLFVGILGDTVPIEVASADADGSYMLNVDRPWLFEMTVAAAVAGTDEGRKVYAYYNNQVQFSPGTYANLVGRVLAVLSTTRVLIAPLWSPLFQHGGMGGVRSISATTTLTKWDVNKTILADASGGAITVNLPAVASVSPGDRITVVNTGGTNNVTLDGNSSETIDGATTKTTGTTQYTSKLTIECNGTGWNTV